jgi:hypothetical protein
LKKLNAEKVKELEARKERIELIKQIAALKLDNKNEAI